jgi:hypothetical protein
MKCIAQRLEEIAFIITIERCMFKLLRLCNLNTLGKMEFFREMILFIFISEEMERDRDRERGDSSVCFKNKY